MRERREGNLDFLKVRRVDETLKICRELYSN